MRPIWADRLAIAAFVIIAAALLILRHACQSSVEQHLFGYMAGSCGDTLVVAMRPALIAAVATWAFGRLADFVVTGRIR